jgi:conserved oligomeric Golgi complex subunit 1
MRSDISLVEEKLGRVGKGCGRSVVGGMVGGLGKLEGDTEGEREKGWRARGKCLGMCGVIAGRLLKRPEKNLVLAAKVLVLGRLLSKSVGDSAKERSRQDQEAVEEMKRKLGGLRRRLLRGVEKTLQRSNGGDLLQALAAYSLATSWGAKDVLRHFLHIRAEALTLAFDNDEGEVPGVVRALELYTRTLLDVQALVPRRLSEALAGLKAKALLKDEAIRELEGLRLDVCERWFGDEILFFTPYIRHDDLEGSLAVETLKGWAKKASEVLLDGLSKSLQRMNEFKTVVELRTRILEIWIKEGGKARGFDPSILLDGVRKVVNDRMVQLLETRINKLHLVATEVEGTLGSWREGITDKQESHWDANMLDMEITHGAGLFKQEVLARTHGRNDAVSRPFKGYQTWRQLVDETITVIEQLKKQRWDDNLEDIEDDLALESRNILLSTDDPNMLQDHLDTSLEKAYKDLHEKIASLLASYEGDQIGSISIYILRVIRDIRTELPKNKSLQSFGLALVPLLHERLASTISEELIKSFSKSFRKKKVAGRSLWEGNPELPVQPSPATFKLLNGLTLAMAKAGNDLWSPNAIAVLKKDLRSELGNSWSTALKEQEEKVASKTNGDTPNGEVDSEEPNEEGQSNGVEVVVDPALRKDVLIQSLFDILLLQSSFNLPNLAADDELQKLGGTLEEQIDLEAASRKRLQQAAKDYWKRTSLLFGLLV